MNNNLFIHIFKAINVPYGIPIYLYLADITRYISVQGLATVQVASARKRSLGGKAGEEKAMKETVWRSEEWSRASSAVWSVRCRV